MKLVIALLLGTAMVACKEQRRIKFINLSAHDIDSVQIGASSADKYMMTFPNISSGDSVIAAFPEGKPTSNNHDATVFITVFLKDLSVLSGDSYQDLSGRILADYTVTLDTKRQLTWKTGK